MSVQFQQKCAFSGPKVSIAQVVNLKNLLVYIVAMLKKNIVDWPESQHVARAGSSGRKYGGRDID